MRRNTCGACGTAATYTAGAPFVTKDRILCEADPRKIPGKASHPASTGADAPALLAKLPPASLLSVRP